MNIECTIFVEGPRDQITINAFLRKLKTNMDSIRFFEYSVKEPKSVNRYIRTIKNMHQNYIMISDYDGRIDKREKVLNSYTSVDSEKIYIAKYEIESWIIAGLSDDLKVKYNIKNSILRDTEGVTKEVFENLVPASLTDNMFIQEILEKYDIQLAISRNNSLKLFLEYVRNNL